MGLFGAFQDIAAQISKTTPFSFDGISTALKYNADDVAKSFATQKGVKMGKELRSMKKSLKGLQEGSDEYIAQANKIATAQSNFDTITAAHRMGTADAVNTAYQELTGKNKIGVLNTMSGYFGDAKYGKIRTKAAIGTAAGVGIGGRYLSGGNFTTNAQGERDIVGIPFV